MAALKFIFFLSCWTFTGITATDSSETHYQLKNSSVCLHTKKQPSHKSGEWLFGKTLIADKEVINTIYVERVSFIYENLTLCINKLTENDTGIYEASYVGNDYNKIYESHHVIVQEMVPNPVMTVEHYNLSAGLCNFTVNCSIQDDWLWSKCDKDGCRTYQGSFNKLNITIITDNTAVVCSGSNYVSRNNISESTPQCFVTSNSEQKKESQPDSNIVTIIIIIIASVILLSGCAGLAKQLRLFSQKKETTSAVQSIQSGPLETQRLSESRVSTSSSEPEPSYENVETTQSQENTIPRNEQILSESERTDTVYSFPRKADTVKSDRGNDALEDRESQKTLTFVSIDVNKEQSLTQTETVYSMLQMPKKSELIAPPRGQI